jgi:hypothetical protein
LWSTGPPVYGIYEVYEDSISFNPSTRRVEEVPSGLTTRSCRSPKERRLYLYTLRPDFGEVRL